MDENFEDLVAYILAYAKNNILAPNHHKTKLRESFSPKELQEKIHLTLSENGANSQNLLKLIQKVIDNSLNTNHPYFMNQMFGKSQPISFLADILIAIQNTSMYTYEVAPVFSMIEQEVIAKLSSKIWDKNYGDGVFTAGGSMSNMNALFLAREQHLKQAKQQGLFNEKPIAIFVSEQAHYSFTKGVNFMGLGIDSLIKIPSKANAKIDINALKIAIEKAKEKGRTPIMLIGIAGTTISGTYDDLESLGKIAKEQHMWFHVDGAYGGSLLFSDKEKHRLKGIEQADSVTWNFHKIMGMTLSTASILTKEKGLLNTAFNVDAGYLFHEDDINPDLGQKSLQGGRRPDAFKLWLYWKQQGDRGLAKHIEILRKSANFLADSIINNPKFELFERPESAIVCFRYLPQSENSKNINELNIAIRNQIFKEGEIIFNYALIHGNVYLRCVLIDPNFTNLQLSNIIKEIEKTGDALTL